MKCEICNKEYNGVKGLSIHLKKKHLYDDKNLQDYYDKYLKKESEGECYFCKKKAIFFGFTKGYHRICSSKKCLGKTRATGTYEFLMYKYGLSKDDSIKLIKIKSKDRGEKIKISLEKKLEKNPNFYKEKSHQSKEYWLKKGYSEKESIVESKKVMDMIHKKTREKMNKYPELYKDIYPTQIKYWIKKGFTKKESLKKVKERQQTFTLEKCLLKYGKKEGINKWNKRQLDWSKKNGN